MTWVSASSVASLRPRDSHVFADFRPNRTALTSSRISLTFPDRPIVKTNETTNIGGPQQSILLRYFVTRDVFVLPRHMAVLVLTVLRGMEALRKGGVSGATITATGEQAIAVLPRAPVAP